MTAAVWIRSSEGLHYIEGLPGWLEWVYRGTIFVLAVICVGMLAGILSQRASVNRGLWWVALGCFIICLRAIVLQYERWSVSITIEAAVALPALLALANGMRLRLRDGTIGQ